MTEQVPPTEGTDPEGPGPEGTDDEEVPAGAEASTTGVPAVDAALADLDRLDEAPVEEHLAAFERAHESLRSALDTPSADRPRDPH
jgi:hypothetical protein